MLATKRFWWFDPLPPDRTGSIAEVAVVEVVEKTGRSLGAEVRFEPHRIGHEYLAKAYEQLAPIPRRDFVRDELRPGGECPVRLQHLGGAVK